MWNRNGGGGRQAVRSDRNQHGPRWNDSLRVVKASGLAAETELSSVNGGVKAGFERWDGVKSVSLKTVNGGVDLELPAGADADLSASTLNGNISGDVAVQKNWPVGREVKTRLGKGGPKIEVSSVNGSLRFHLAGTAEKN